MSKLKTFSMALGIAASLAVAACGGGDSPQAVEPAGEPYRLFIFERFDPQGARRDTRAGEQTGGVLYETERFGGLTFAPPGRDGTADGEVYSNAAGTTYWVEAEAPNGDVLDPDSRIGSQAVLKQVQRYRKHARDATMELVISDARLEIIDSNGVSPLFAHCPWEQAATNSERCFDTLAAHLEMWVSVDVIGSGADAARLDGAVQLSGWGGNFEHAVHSRQADPLGLRTERSLVNKPLWRASDFELEYDPARPGEARVRLRRPLRVPIDLDLVPVWTAQAPVEFVLTVVVDAKTNNRRGREAVVFARLRDPLNVGGVVVETTGLQAVSGPLPDLPPPKPQPSPVCANTAGQDGGTLQFTKATYVVPEFGVLESVVFVSRTGGTSGPAGARLRASDGSAMAGVHYEALDTMVWFADGDDTPRAIPLKVTNDALATGDRVLGLVLDDPQGCATLGALTQARVTIVDDDLRAPPPPTFSVGGTVTGLVGSGLVLEDRAQFISLPVPADGPFSFNRVYPAGAHYDVRVAAQPTGPVQVCAVSQGIGQVNADVTDIRVECSTATPPSGLDPGFGSAGKVTSGLASGAKAVVRQSDGKYLVAGATSILRFNADGSLDAAFGSGGRVSQVLGGDASDEIYDLALQPDGRIVVVGTGRTSPASVLLYDWVVTRLNADGSRDAAFNGGQLLYVDFIGAQDRATRVLLQPDGRIVVTGTATTVYDRNSARQDSDLAAMRLNIDGSRDTTFGNGGFRVVGSLGRPMSEFANAAALQADGKILIAGRTIEDNSTPSDTVVVRLNADGSLDASFGTGGVRGIGVSPLNDNAVDLVVQPDGRIVLAVFAQWHTSLRTEYVLLRLMPDATPDTGFGDNGRVHTDIGALDDIARAVALQPDGRIIVVGQASSATVSDFGIVRYQADGRLDTGFGDQGVLLVDFFGSTDGANDVLIEPDGRVLVVGTVRNASSWQVGMLRLMPTP